MDVGKQLRQLREARGWNMHRLSLAAKVPYPTVWRLEKGTIRNPKLELLNKLAAALEVTVDALTGGEVQQLRFEHLFPDDPLAGAVFRGYEKLPSQQRKQVLRFVQFLAEKEEEDQRDDDTEG